MWQAKIGKEIWRVRNSTDGQGGFNVGIHKILIVSFDDDTIVYDDDGHSPHGSVLRVLPKAKWADWFGSAAEATAAAEKVAADYEANGTKFKWDNSVKK